LSEAQAPKPLVRGARLAVDVRELAVDEWPRAFPLLSVLRPDVREEEFLPAIVRQHAQGYVLAGARAGGELVGLIGFREQENFSRGRYLYVDDLVVTPARQHGGVGAALLQYAVERGYAEGLRAVVLHARPSAIAFYERLGFKAVGSPGMAITLGERPTR
jgi:ribosomal protein S18 acetylase RimI-like enzyme